MIADVEPRITYNCNGTLEEFSFTFPIISSSDLQVVLKNTTTNASTVLTETTHYVVRDPDGVSGGLADFTNGGSILTDITPPYGSTYNITLARATPYTQTADFTEGMPTLVDTFEMGLDKLTMLIQQVRDTLQRSPYCPVDDPADLDMEIPNVTSRAGKYLAFDSDGEPTAVDLTTIGVSVTALAQALLADADAADARDTLGIDGAIEDYIIDEDDMASDDDTKVPTQQSVKAYVDTNVAAVDAMPTGSYLMWPTETAPTGYLECAGQSLLRASYADLFAIIGTMYGTADGTHFNLPDFRGIFPRAWAHGETTDPDKATRTKPTATGATISDGDHVGTAQADEQEAHDHGEAGTHTHSINYYVVGGASGNLGLGGGNTGYGPYGGATSNTGSHSHTSVGGNETRPANLCVMMCIKVS